jgi:hypothetical protein
MTFLRPLHVFIRRELEIPRLQPQTAHQAFHNAVPRAWM